MLSVNVKDEVIGINDCDRTQYNDIVLEDSERTPCEIWTRVMGYFRPLESFNIGKVSEHKERKYYTESKAAKSLGIN
jgi:anaerobic ribonucleoside-triphosphate reductase